MLSNNYWTDKSEVTLVACGAKGQSPRLHLSQIIALMSPVSDLDPPWSQQFDRDLWLFLKDHSACPKHSAGVVGALKRASPGMDSIEV